MTKSFDAIMKILEDEGDVPDEKAKAIIDEHGPLTAEEKKQVASAMRMNKALKGGDDEDGDDGDDEVTMDQYLQALSTLDSDDATEAEKKQAQAIKDKFEG